MSAGSRETANQKPAQSAAYPVASESNGRETVSVDRKCPASAVQVKAESKLPRIFDNEV
jgi:hypothetical protein